MSLCCLVMCVFCLSSVLILGVKFVHWPSSPSQTCRFIPKRTQRQRLTSVLTALSPLRTHHTWPSTCVYTWASNLTAAPTVRNVLGSFPICSSTPGLISTLLTACSWWLSWLLLYCHPPKLWQEQLCTCIFQLDIIIHRPCLVEFYMKLREVLKPTMLLSQLKKKSHYYFGQKQHRHRSWRT